MSPCPGLDAVLGRNGLRRYWVKYTVGDCFFDALVWLMSSMLGVCTNVAAIRAAGCAAFRQSYVRYVAAL